MKITQIGLLGFKIVCQNFELKFQLGCFHGQLDNFIDAMSEKRAYKTISLDGISFEVLAQSEQVCFQVGNSDLYQMKYYATIDSCLPAFQKMFIEKPFCNCQETDSPCEFYDATQAASRADPSIALSLRFPDPFDC